MTQLAQPSALTSITRRPLALAALSLSCIVPLLWPGDAPFINDEPLLIASALTANSADRLAELGLAGTFGFTYGPAPTWVYQLLLGLTHDLVLLAVLHTALIVVTTAVALWWLSRSLHLWVWFAPVPLLSPYFWFYARVLWDNPFLFPFSAMAVAGYAAHLDSGSKMGLRLSLAAATAIPLVHLMGLALVVPLAAHMLLVRWRSLWAQRLAVIAVLAAFLILAWPYWRYLATATPPQQAGDAGLSGWIFPLFGARLLSASGLAYFYGPEPVAGVLFRAAAGLSLLAYGLVWSGLGIAIWRTLAAMRARQWTPRAHVAAILVAAIACQMALDGFSGKYQHPHYQSGTWIATTLLAWFAVDRLASTGSIIRWAAPAVTGMLAIALLTSVAALAIGLHRTSGTRAIYGPTLANQQKVARTLATYPPRSHVSTSVIPYLQFPHALDTLRRLNRPHGDGPVRSLEVRYASPDPSSGAIEVSVVR